MGEEKEDGDVMKEVIGFGVVCSSFMNLIAVVFSSFFLKQVSGFNIMCFFMGLLGFAGLYSGLMKVGFSVVCSPLWFSSWVFFIIIFLFSALFIFFYFWVVFCFYLEFFCEYFLF